MTKAVKNYGVFSKKTRERTGLIKVMRKFATRGEARAWREPFEEGIVHIPTGTIVR